MTPPPPPSLLTALSQVRVLYGEVTDANSVVTTYTYDVLNRRVTTSDALGNTSTVVYDDVGNVIETIDPFLNSSFRTYDALSRLKTSTDALGGVTQFTYDALGNRLTLTDPAGNTTTWTYDLLDRVATETNELGLMRSYGYDAAGNLTLLTKRDSDQIGYGYDDLNRRITEEWIIGGTVVDTLTFGFDVAGQLASATDGATTVQLQYDSLGRLSTDTQLLSPSITAVLSSTYDAAGRRTQLTTTLNGVADSVIDYTIGSGGPVTQIQQSGATVEPKRVTYSYDAGGRRTGLDRFADLAGMQLVSSTDFNYDTVGRLDELDHVRGTTTFATYSFTWDAGNRLASLDSLTDGSATYTYDDVHQLISATYANHPDISFSYDANGNRTGTGYTTGDDNRLLSDGGSSFGYDANGNLIRRTDSSTGAVIEYTYDHRDRLTDVRYLNSAGGTLAKHVRYGYDALNRRVSQSVDTDGDGDFDGTEYRLNDGLRNARDGAGDSLLLRLDGGGAVTHRYLHGAAVDEVLAEEKVDPLGGASEVHWTLSDHQGSVRDLVEYDSAADHAAVVDHLFYDAFGSVVDESVPATDRLFGYTGREWDDETDLQYNRARYYDPKIGRWISQDPIGFEAGDLNLYRYVGNGATTGIDPSGLQDPRVGPYRGPNRQLLQELDERGHLTHAVIEVRSQRDLDQLYRLGGLSMDTHIEASQRLGSHGNVHVPIMENAETAVGSARFRDKTRRFGGALEAVGGAAEVAASPFVFVAPVPGARPAALAMVAHGADHIQAGVQTAATGYVHRTMVADGTTKVLVYSGMDEYPAQRFGDYASILSDFAVPAAGANRSAAGLRLQNSGGRQLLSGRPGINLEEGFAPRRNLTPERGDAPWRPNPAHNAASYEQYKLQLMADEIANPGDLMHGSVVVDRFNAPKVTTAAQEAQLREYASLATLAEREGFLSPTGRVSTGGSVEQQAARARVLERRRAESAGAPYGSNVAGHAPDSGWLGYGDPPFWLSMEGRVNATIAGQQQRYPIGYRPTRFIFRGDLPNE